MGSTFIHGPNSIMYISPPPKKKTRYEKRRPGYRMILHCRWWCLWRRTRIARRLQRTFTYHLGPTNDRPDAGRACSRARARTTDRRRLRLGPRRRAHRAACARTCMRPRGRRASPSGPRRCLGAAPRARVRALRIWIVVVSDATLSTAAEKVWRRQTAATVGSPVNDSSKGNVFLTLHKVTFMVV